MGMIILYFSVVGLILLVWIFGSLGDNHKYPTIKFKDFLVYYAKNPHAWVLGAFTSGVYQATLKKEYRFLGVDRVRFWAWKRKLDKATRAEENDEAMQQIKEYYNKSR